MVEQLEVGGFFSESLTKRRLFASVHDAVLYCLNHRGDATLPRYESSIVSRNCSSFVDLWGICAPFNLFCEDKIVQLVNYCL